MHARSGGSIEVMGILQGHNSSAWACISYIWNEIIVPIFLSNELLLHNCIAGKLEENTFVVMDAFALPVEGTETRVTALDEGYEYMVCVFVCNFSLLGKTSTIVTAAECPCADDGSRSACPFDR